MCCREDQAAAQVAAGVRGLWGHSPEPWPVVRREDEAAAQMADSAFLRRVRAECGAPPAGAPDSSAGGTSGAARGGAARAPGRSWPAKPSGARPKRVDSSTLGDSVTHTTNSWPELRTANHAAGRSLIRVWSLPFFEAFPGCLHALCAMGVEAVALQDAVPVFAGGSVAEALEVALSPCCTGAAPVAHCSGRPDMFLPCVRAAGVCGQFPRQGLWPWRRRWARSRPCCAGSSAGACCQQAGKLVAVSCISQPSWHAAMTQDADR